MQNKNESIKVLVVEDDALTAENIRNVLERSGYEMLPPLAAGEEAVKQVRLTPPDLVLMDIMLDGEMDGIETARAIRARMNIPIIYLTAYSDKQTLERAKVVEPYGYILKPFNEDDVANAIKMALYKHQAEERLRREKEINAALALLSQALLKSPSSEDISHQVLEQSKLLTHSSTGFVSFIDQNSKRLVNPTLQQEIWEKCQVAGKSALFKSNDGLSGWVLNHKQLLIANNPAQDPRSCGLPEGHIPLHNFMAVPALIEKKLVGIVAVANKEKDYEEGDAEVLQRLATIYALALRQKHTQSQLDLYREHLEEMVKDRTNELEAANKKLLNEMAERKKAEEQLLQADKMVALGTLVSGVAHEINNPNNFIMMNTPLLLDIWKGILPILEHYYKEEGDFSIQGFQYRELKEIAVELLEGVQEGARRIQNIVKELKDFYRQDSDEIEQSIDINTVIKSAVTLTSPMIRKSTQRFYVNYGKNIPTFPGKFQRLEQVMINFIQNSCQALPDKEKAIHITSGFDGETNKITVKIEDEGIGIEPHHLKLIMNPFFTTKRESGGTGLGLSISSKIITDHGGFVHFDSIPGQGTTAIITLPVKEK